MTDTPWRHRLGARQRRVAALSGSELRGVGAGRGRADAWAARRRDRPTLRTGRRRARPRALQLEDDEVVDVDELAGVVLTELVTQRIGRQALHAVGLF